MTISLPDDVLVTLSINKSALKVKGADRAFILRLIEQMEKYEADLVESSTGATVPDSGN